MMMIFAYMMLTLRGLVQDYDLEFAMVTTMGYESWHLYFSNEPIV